MVVTPQADKPSRQSRGLQEQTVVEGDLPGGLHHRLSTRTENGNDEPAPTLEEQANHLVEHPEEIPGPECWVWGWLECDGYPLDPNRR